MPNGSRPPVASDPQLSEFLELLSRFDKRVAADYDGRSLKVELWVSGHGFSGALIAAGGALSELNHLGQWTSPPPLTLFRFDKIHELLKFLMAGREEQRELARRA